MDGRKASEITGLTYRQLNHYVEKVDGLLTKPSESQGKPRDFCYRDLVLLRLVNYLITDGYRLPQIKQAASEVLKNWHNVENPDDAGFLFDGVDGFRWTPTTEFQLSSNGAGVSIDTLKTLPKFFYNVKKIAHEFSDIQQLEFEIMQDIRQV